MGKPISKVSVLAIDPGVTTGICLLTLRKDWLEATDGRQWPGNWEGLSKAIFHSYHAQVGRYPMSWDYQYGRARRTTNDELYQTHMPVYADESHAGPSLAKLQSILDGEWRAGGGELTINTVNELGQIRQVSGLLEIWPKAALVIEDFTLRKFNRDEEFLSPVRVGRGILQEELLHGSVGRIPFLQEPSMAIDTVTDPRLKRAGLYRPGMEHANDAARHAALFCVRARKDKSLIEAAWPRGARAA